MNIIIKARFKRDVSKVRHRDLLLALKRKIEQIETATNNANITGLKLLNGYSHHYRIHVKSERHTYRIGAVIRGKTIWLVRFLARKKIYQKFP